MYKGDLYKDLGGAIELLAGSKYHGHFELKRYIQVEIAPAFRNQQAKLFFDSEEPTALLTWARISSDVLNDLSSTHRSLRDNEWRSGDIAFVNDLVVKGKHLNYVIEVVRNSIFSSDSTVYAFRRSESGLVRRLCKLKNYPVGYLN